jgi:hypothetical protein
MRLHALDDVVVDRRLPTGRWLIMLRRRIRMNFFFLVVVVMTTPSIAAGVAFRIDDHIGIGASIGQKLHQEELNIVEGLLLSFGGLLLGLKKMT